VSPRAVTRDEAIAEVVGLVGLVASPSTSATFVGIDGRGAAGKSTLADDLAAAVVGAVVVRVDDFSGPRVAAWDWGRFRRQVIEPLLAGRSGRYQRWDWDADAGAEWHDVPAGRLVIVEGVSATRAEVGVPWALRIWVEASRPVRLGRARERDGAAMMPRWLQDWMPSEEAYIAAQRPDLAADLIVSGEPASGL
jgi:uridine kinase